MTILEAIEHHVIIRVHTRNVAQIIVFLCSEFEIDNPFGALGSSTDMRFYNDKSYLCCRFDGKDTVGYAEEHWYAKNMKREIYDTDIILGKLNEEVS